ncbi:MAG: hypothetical protein JWM85_2233 [Acidimicrobiaceae bacterium]|nr:hypothetical protein [Acidimicrobiaceae bacterium]
MTTATRPRRIEKANLLDAAAHAHGLAVGLEDAARKDQPASGEMRFALIEASRALANRCRAVLA